jgi:16S rRNA (guanine527-N7)-methyltransferase
LFSSSAPTEPPAPLFSKSELARLNEISVASGSPVRPGFVALCEAFLAELIKWNRKMNLVSRADEERIVERHVLDSLCLLSVERRLSGKKIIDLGSGAGFPGLVLAMWEPEAQFLLVESRSKRVAFLKAARRTLGLKNVEALHSRLEELKEAEKPDSADHPPPRSAVDMVVSRGVGDALGLVASVGRLLAVGGVFVLYKGVTEPEEIQHADRILKQGFKLEIVTPSWETPTRLIVMRKLP